MGDKAIKWERDTTIQHIFLWTRHLVIRFFFLCCWSPFLFWSLLHQAGEKWSCTLDLASMGGCTLCTIFPLFGMAIQYKAARHHTQDTSNKTRMAQVQYKFTDIQQCPTYQGLRHLGLHLLEMPPVVGGLLSIVQYDTVHNCFVFYLDPTTIVTEFFL